MTRTFASPADLPASPSYSHVVAVPAGRLVVTAGQVAMAADGSVVGSTWAEQSRAALENVGRALAAGGASWSDVVKLTWYVTAGFDLVAIREAREAFIDAANPPASTLVEVAGLFRPDLLVEVEAMAVVAG